MTTALQIRPATRQGVKPLIGLYGESGCGKTLSSLLLARGFVGPTGKIVLIDTESGRGSLYADVLPGGYDVLDLFQPFSPLRYTEAVGVAEDSGAGILVIDSASHEWEGSGGVLDMASENEAASGRAGLHNWKGPKMEHAKFMLRLLQSRLPVIVCLRAKHKTKQIKGTPEMAESGAIRRDQIGKTAIVKDDFTTPIQADDFIFEMTAHAEVLKDHSINLTKCSHPSLRGCFPESGMISEEHGQRLAQWCNNPLGSTPAKTPASPLKARLWTACESIRGAAKAWDKAEEWMVSKKILSAGQKVSALTDVELSDALDKVQIELSAN